MVMSETFAYYEQTPADRAVIERLKGRFLCGVERMFVGVGWTALLVEMENRLSAIDPDYTLLFIDDKSGRMEVTFEASRPTGDEVMTDDEWEAAQIAADERQEEMAAVVREIEIKSATVCSATGHPGVAALVGDRVFVLSPAAIDRYAAVPLEDEVVTAFPVFTVVFQMDDEPEERTVLSEHDAKVLAQTGLRTNTPTAYDDHEEGKPTVTVGHIEYDENGQLVRLADGNLYSTTQVAEFIGVGVHEAIRVALDRFERDTQNLAHES